MELRSLVATTSLFFTLGLSATPGTIGLGVGASSPNEAIVKVNGRDQHVQLSDVPSGTESAKQFLQCLVAGRIVRINGGKLTLLDGTSVNEQVGEYLQSRTSADPCTLGKAAYAPRPAASDPAVPSSGPAAGASSKKDGAGRSKPAAKKPAGEAPQKH